MPEGRNSCIPSCSPPGLVCTRLSSHLPLACVHLPPLLWPFLLTHHWSVYVQPLPHTVPPVCIYLPFPFSASGLHSSALLLTGLLVRVPRLHSCLSWFAYSCLSWSLGSCMLTLLFPSPSVDVCQPSHQPPGSHALSALCLCLLVSATWLYSLGFHSQLFSFFSCSFGLTWVRFGSFILWCVYFWAP